MKDCVIADPTERELADDVLIHALAFLHAFERQVKMGHGGPISPYWSAVMAMLDAPDGIGTVAQRIVGGYAVATEAR